MNNKTFITNLLAEAGVTINGPGLTDIKVRRKCFYDRAMKGSLGFGESYMDGDWYAADLAGCIQRILEADLESQIKQSRRMQLHIAKAALFNLQTKARAFNNAQHHYDIGIDLYKGMLDERMVYTCGYWKGADNLTMAQEAKLDLVCQKMGLRQGMHVLDIGCGFGSFAKYAAQHYGVMVTGVTVAEDHASFAQESCKGLPVRILLQDYRDVEGKFDRIISLGMFEHVGAKNHRTYMEVAHRCLKNDGLFLLHTIGKDHSTQHNDPWIDKYIFPGGLIPSVQQISKAYHGLFRLWDWHVFDDNDYAKTLKGWFCNFARDWPRLEKIDKKYNTTFFKMWKYYLLACAGSFAAGKNHLWQIVLSKEHGPLRSYAPVR